MSGPISIEIILASTLLWGSVNNHQRQVRDFRGASQSYLGALTISTVIGSLIGLGLMLFYFTKMAWYYPLILFVIDLFLIATVFTFFDLIIGVFPMSLISWITWPIGAIWFYKAILTL
jgi:uncharacterized membrane protein